MRLHHKIEIVAVGFQELLDLETICQKILAVLQKEPNGVVIGIFFKWGHTSNPEKGWVQIKLFGIVNNPLQSDSPDGCSDKIWAKLIAARLECHLLAGNMSCDVVRTEKDSFILRAVK